jgi:long-chain fatty acid transport protein
MKTRASGKAILLAATALGTIGVSEAQAGGFYVHEQSAYFQGSSFAGVAAGGPALSAMFWNPATITQHGPGLSTEKNGSWIIPRSKIHPTAATSPTGVDLTGFGSTGDIATDALVPATYNVYGFNDRIFLGVGLNAPFGMNTKAGPWAGMFYGSESDVFSLNFNPNLAIKITDWLSVGVGGQAQYFKVKVHSFFPGSGATGPFPLLSPIGPDQLRIDGDTWDLGFTAGVTFTPTPWTTIGLGYRSRINQSVLGDIYRPAFTVPVPDVELGLVPLRLPFAFVNFKADVPLPDIATVSIRQKITEAFTLLGTVEWTNWSRLDRVRLDPFVLGSPIPAGAIPGIPRELAFDWRDGWMYSGGFEYQWSPSLAVRAGVAWETSPITDRTRTPRLPDTDRLWVSAGATYNWNERLALELGYSHIFLDDAAIALTAASGNPSFNPGLGTLVGTANTAVDILSFALRYRFLPAAPPVVTKG